jgi:CubicO group peptidase (beta-lactamase class C family)
MPKRNAAILMMLVGVVAVACAAPPATTDTGAPVVVGTIGEGVDEKIRELMDKGQIPSLAAAIVVNDEVAWANGYGDQSDLDTAYMVGSIEKSIIATAVLQLVERGTIDLDSDVNEYLPFAVRHPDFPNTPVTVRMLLAHRGGLAHDGPLSRCFDQDATMLRWRIVNLLDMRSLPCLFRRMDREEFLRQTFAPGENGTSPEVWLSQPGTAYQYSNVGLQVLLPYVIERVTQVPYEEHVRTAILEPLDLTGTAFEASGYGERLAVPYEEVQGELRALPRTGWNAARLRMTVTDLAAFLAVHMNDGRHEDVRVLQPESVEAMHQLISPLDWPAFFGLRWNGYGLGWELYADDLQGHPGACPGFLANIVYREQDDGAYGVVLMANRGSSIDTVDWATESYAPILLILLEEAAQMHRAQVEH